MKIASTGFRPRGLNIPALAAAALIAGAGLLMGQAKAPPAGPAPSQPVAAPAAPSAPSAPAAPAAPGGTDEGAMSMLDFYVKGGIFMHPILLCSLVGVAVIIERLVSLRRGNVIPAAFLPSLRGVLRDPARDRQAAIDFCRGQDTPIARVVAAGLSKYPRGEDAIEKAIEDAGGLEVIRLRRNLRLLYTVIAIAPLLGLIGTISGMIDAFAVTAKVGTGKGEMLARGIYEALITTYAGLLVAIPATVAYHFFQGRIEKLITHMNDVSTKFVEDFLTVPSPRPRAAATNEDLPPLPAGALKAGG